MASCLPPVDCTNMSDELESLIKQRMDVIMKQWVLCQCGYSIVSSATKYCMICETSFEDSWKFHKAFFEEQVKIEKAAIEAHERGEESEESGDEVGLTFPPNISMSLKKFFKEHVLYAHDNFKEAWATHIVDKGLGDTVQSTIDPFKEYYGQLGSTKAKGDVLNRIRDAEDGVKKIEEFAKILEAAKTA